MHTIPFINIKCTLECLFFCHKASRNTAYLLISCLLLAIVPLSACVKKTDSGLNQPVISETQKSGSDAAENKKTATAEKPAVAAKKTKETVSSGRPADSSPKLPATKGKAQKILETAYTQIGRLYRYGGTSPKTGFDCSGFTKWVFAQNGIKLPRSSGEQLHAGRPVSRKSLRPGDLLIYSRRIGRRRGTHVGIYVGNGKFIHSPRTGHRIHISDAFDSYRTRRFVAARRVIEDPDAAPLPAGEQQYLAEQALKRNKPKHEPPKLHENTFAESYKIYHVRRGDTISGLAKRFHVRTKQLLAANQLKKRDVLQLKQRLMIPVRGGTTGTIVKPGEARPEVGKTVKHTVKPGESLGVLAQKYGVSSNRIARANKLRSKHTIRAGQILVIPGQHAESARNKKGTSAQIKAADEEIIVASVEEEDEILVSSPKTSKNTYHTVKRGETIWGISRKYGVGESKLLAANKLNKKHTLRLGQRLLIPVRSTKPGKTAQTKTPPPQKKARTTYVVKSGDTIWKIAKRHGVSEKQLLAKNKLSKKHVIKPGQKLVIP